ncbi:hypothetical protein SEUCBS139899_002346 [Sporothrix eucalyptigena]|uniref:Uncharacterized protein n=1 Tax=Sporothrix eucalyptigena TaxID=1812306 RepID=A0ABP0BUT1_9PEZI
MSIDAIMHSVPPKSPTLSNRSSRDYDTGFPEPFCGSGNTTWRHPEANISPDACISSDDIAVDRLYTRSRRSFLHHKNKRTTLSHGKLTSADLQAYNELSSIVEIPSRTELTTASSSSSQNSRLSKDGESLNRPSSSASGLLRGDTNGATSNDANSIHGSINQPTTSHSGFRHGGSVFRKFRHHD